MGKSSPSPPATPDPYQTASAQGTSNANTATAQTALNNANTYTPYGQTTYTVTGSQTITNPDGTTTSVPTYSMRQDLSGVQQNLLNQEQGLEGRTNAIASGALGRIGQTLSNPLQSSQFTPVQSSVGATPSLATGYGTTANATGYDQGGQIQTGVPVQQAATTFGQTAQGIQGQIGNTAGNIQYNVDTQGIQQARDAATNAALARLQPSMDQQNSALQASLANQGVSLGSSAYGAAQFNENQANNDLRLGAVQVGDAEQQALYGQALSSGQFTNAAQAQDFDQQAQRGAFANAAQSQDFGQQQARGQFQQAGTAANNQSALAAGTFANTAQAQQNAENAASAAFYNSGVNANNATSAAQAAFGNTAATQDYQNRLSAGAFNNAASAQQLQQAMALQNQQINEISALRSGNQVTLPGAQAYSAGTLDQTPISADVYQSAALQNQQYQAQLQASAANTAAMGSALGGITGGIGRKSDRRLKTDVVRFATARNGLPIYAYRMPGEAPGWHVGMMADEVALLRPEAVWTGADGFARVDYERAVA